ncbi:hypothetical protein AMTRI_Chr12g273790 [Amborella trichopoda]|uniref:Myb-like domain-containing protein n=1 Tax=Amborella trichopoda TaxID=13333 RepID=W1PGN0_AMBTC|nr:hypothetical protein AMTR_s00019p00124000 [Amborella trichopoda]
MSSEKSGSLSVEAKQETEALIKEQDFPAKDQSFLVKERRFPESEQDFPAIEVLPLNIRPPLEREELQVKREKEHKRRSKNWTRTETLKLISLRSEMESRFAKTGRKSELWDEIASEMRRESFCRDSQQCRDKWEKLTAGYKEARDGVKAKEEFPFFQDLDPILSLKAQRKALMAGIHQSTGKSDDEEEETGSPADFPTSFPVKRRKSSERETLKDFLESLISRQHRFFVELLDAMDKREKAREKQRLEREERWRAEERAHRAAFQNAMILLTKKLVTEVCKATPLQKSPENHFPATFSGKNAAKKRSKNWKRAEVLKLIKARSEMASRFDRCSRRAALWSELSEKLALEGVKRDGKQCREKWDKLMAEFKDVTDGKRRKDESPYFQELLAMAKSSEPPPPLPCTEPEKSRFHDISEPEA